MPDSVRGEAAGCTQKLTPGSQPHTPFTCPQSSLAVVNRRPDRNNRGMQAKWSLAPLLALSALLWASCQRGSPELADPQDLVFIQQGTIPIIITAPHGGTARVPGVGERTSRAAVKAEDEGTHEIAELLVMRLEVLVEGRLYAVIARFHRKYVDANRPEGEAFEDPGARPYYLAYHESIRDFVDVTRRTYSAGALLIDIHGHSKAEYEDQVCRGTRDGMTVTRLTERRGFEALIGPASILGSLEASGFNVFPPNVAPHSGQEGPCFDGGYAVVTYGSHNVDGIDALQLEFGSSLTRRRSDRVTVADALAEAIAIFYESYLLPADAP